MTLERVTVECKLTPQKCRFTLIWSHFDSSLSSKCHFDKATIDVETRHTREVKMALRIIVLK